MITTPLGKHILHRPTKEKFYVSTYLYSKQLNPFSALGGFSGPGVENRDDAGYVNCHLPHDFDYLTAIRLVFIPQATATPMYVRVITNYCLAAEAYTEHSENVDLHINTVLNRMTELNIYDAVDIRPLQAGDYIGVEAVRSEFLPTENTDLILIGARIRYRQR